MSFRTRRVIFMTPFYMLFEFFLLKYILLLIGDVWDEYILLLAIMTGLLHLTPMFFEAKKSRKITRFLSTVDGVWMWASVMFLIDILIIYLVGSFIEIPHAVVLMMLVFVPILGVYNYYKAHKLVVHEKTLVFDDIEGEINIVHMSDIHFGSVRHRDIIKDVSLKLQELEDVCDIAIISGDLADGSSIVEEDDLMAFGDVEMPILFTPGNHDFYPGIDNVIKAAKNAGIIVLDNDAFEFKNLNVYGLTFSFGDIEMPSTEDLQNSIKSDKINVINYHVPSYWEEFSSLGFNIQLSGHTHGGQFYPVKWFGNRMFGYNMGLFRDRLGNYLHVTTGVGSMDTPMRWGTDSEIVVLRLKKS